MKKEEFVAEYGIAAYEKKAFIHKEYIRKWRKSNPKKVIEHNRKSHKVCDERNPAKRIEQNKQLGRKGGKYYEWKLKYQRTCIPGNRAKIRHYHGRKWGIYKKIIAPDSQIHHEWISGTAGYTGVALVETHQHMHGFIEVIKILDGNITLLTKDEISSRPFASHNGIT